MIASAWQRILLPIAVIVTVMFFFACTAQNGPEQGNTTGDIVQNRSGEVSDIIDGILGVNSNATIVLSLIIKARPESGLNTDVSSYNSNLNIMAQARISAGEDIIVVDMENGAGLDYTSADMEDNLHPSQIGYDKMATNWYPSTVMAINHQLALQAPRPHIDSVTVTNNSMLLELSNLTPGLPLHVERSGSLTPPVWTNAGALFPADSTTNWTDQAGLENSRFYRLVIP